MTEFRFLNNGIDGAIAVGHVARSTERLLAANLAQVDPGADIPANGVEAKHGVAAAPVPPADQRAIRDEIAGLSAEHRRLDDQVNRLIKRVAGGDELQLRRLKKRKLQLKDRIAALQMLLVPDVPA